MIVVSSKPLNDRLGRMLNVGELRGLISIWLDHLWPGDRFRLETTEIVFGGDGYWRIYDAEGLVAVKKMEHMR